MCKPSLNSQSRGGKLYARKLEITQISRRSARENSKLCPSAILICNNMKNADIINYLSENFH